MNVNRAETVPWVQHGGKIDAETHDGYYLMVWPHATNAQNSDADWGWMVQLDGDASTRVEGRSTDRLLAMDGARSALVEKRQARGAVVTQREDYWPGGPIHFDSLDARKDKSIPHTCTHLYTATNGVQVWSNGPDKDFDVLFADYLEERFTVAGLDQDEARAQRHIAQMQAAMEWMEVRHRQEYSHDPRKS